MKEIRFNNRTFDGKYQKLYFLISDINDLLGKPFIFVLGDGNTIKNFNFNFYKLKEGSTKREFARIVCEMAVKQEVFEIKLNK